MFESKRAEFVSCAHEVESCLGGRDLEGLGVKSNSTHVQFSAHPLHYASGGKGGDKAHCGVDGRLLLGRTIGIL
jgi:hypothetical protein